MRCIRDTAGFAALALMLASGGVASAATFVLEDGNSASFVDPASQAGMYDWTTDGVDNLYQQWFWYRVGNGGPEASIDSLALNSVTLTDTNPLQDNRNDAAVISYGGNGFTIEITYILRGGTNGSGTADIAEQIRIINTGQSSLQFRFFQYSDFDLNGDITDASAEILGGNTARQVDQSGYVLTETVTTPMPNRLEINEYANTLNSLNDGASTSLNNVAGPLFNADLTWAFQWNFNLAPGSSFLISKDKQIVPTPGAVALAGVASLLAVRRRRA